MAKKKLHSEQVKHTIDASAESAKSPQPHDPAELARVLRAQLATVTGGLAPDVYVNAWWDCGT